MSNVFIVITFLLVVISVLILLINGFYITDVIVFNSLNFVLSGLVLPFSVVFKNARHNRMQNILGTSVFGGVAGG